MLYAVRVFVLAKKPCFLPTRPSLILRAGFEVITGRFVASQHRQFKRLCRIEKKGFGASVQDWPGILIRGVGADASGPLGHFPQCRFSFQIRRPASAQQQRKTSDCCSAGETQNESPERVFSFTASLFQDHNVNIKAFVIES